MINLENKNIILTGATGGIGGSIVDTLISLKAKLIVAFTESGTTASRVSRYRPPTKILALTPKAEVQRKLTLLWGVVPITVEKLFNVDDFFNKALEQSILNMNLKEKDLLILVAGLPIGVPGGTNLLRVMTVPTKQ